MVGATLSRGHGEKKIERSEMVLERGTGRRRERKETLREEEEEKEEAAGEMKEGEKERKGGHTRTR